jgi:hypothetical protein
MIGDVMLNPIELADQIEPLADQALLDGRVRDEVVLRRVAWMLRSGSLVLGPDYHPAPPGR